MFRAEKEQEITAKAQGGRVPADKVIHSPSFRIGSSIGHKEQKLQTEFAMRER